MARLTADNLALTYITYIQKIKGHQLPELIELAQNQEDSIASTCGRVYVLTHSHPTTRRRSLLFSCTNRLYHFDSRRKQELIAIANRSRVSCINTNRSHNLATSGESRRYVVAFTRFAGRGTWLRQESYTFWPPWVRPWDNRSKCYMDGKKIQCLSNALHHVPSIFNRFPVIQPVSSNVRHFSTFFAHFGLPWVRPWDNYDKCYTVGKRIQCL